MWTGPYVIKASRQCKTPGPESWRFAAMNSAGELMPSAAALAGMNDPEARVCRFAGVREGLRLRSALAADGAEFAGAEGLFGSSWAIRPVGARSVGAARAVPIWTVWAARAIKVGTVGPAGAIPVGLRPRWWRAKAAWTSRPRPSVDAGRKHGNKKKESQPCRPPEERNHNDSLLVASMR